jgi:hypothetical protein
MKHTTAIVYLSLLLLSVSCDRIKDGTKQSINKGGEVVGQIATEFLQGVSEGVDKTLQCTIQFSETLKAAGISNGKFSIESGQNGNKNKLAIYMIFDKDFSGSITAKVFDKNGLEAGRCKADVQAKAGDGRYVDFGFDSRCDIEAKSSIKFE